MADRGWRMRGASFAFVLVLISLGAVAAEGDQLLATMASPAVITLTPPGRGQDQPARVVINVMGFRPPLDGSLVEAVVKAQRVGTDKEQEIGRFGIFPNAEYKAADPSQAQRFSFALTRELASGGPVKVKVELVPVRGKGEGARLEVGGAEIR